MKSKRIIGLLLAAVMSLSCASFNAYAREAGADVVYVNGNIYTVDEAFSTASIIATKGQEIVYVGHDQAEVQQYIADGAQVVDLGGKTVIPGLIEGHMHVLGEGKARSTLDLFWKPKAEILRLIAEEVARSQPGEWIVSRGWNHEAEDWGTDHNWPTKWDLDAIAPNNPVVLTRTDGHSLWANSMAMEIGGVDAGGVKTPDPQGGEILRNASGEAIGIFTDTAMGFVRNNVPADSADQKLRYYKAFQEEMLSYGLTSAMDAGEGLTNINLLRSLYESGEMKVRVYEMLSVGADEQYRAQGGQPVAGLYGNRLSIKATKIVSDGSLGSRSAWLLEDYSDRPEHVGNGRYTDSEIYEIMKRNIDSGFQIGVHAIGDAAVRQVIAQYENIRAAEPDLPFDLRPRIEHFQIVNASDIPRAIEDGIIPAMQAVHATSDKNMAEDRVGPVRILSSYAWRTIIDLGSIIANGSDASVELLNPYHGLYAAVTRMDRNGLPNGGWYRELCMTRQEALRSFTIWAAYAQFEENIKGSLEVGKLADFVVLDRNIMTCPAFDIKDTRALMTVLGGEQLYFGATGLKLSGAKTTLNKGKTLEIAPVFAPANATNQDVVWASSNPRIATVENGVVTAHAAGTVVITATTVDGGFIQKATIRVM